MIEKTLEELKKDIQDYCYKYQKAIENNQENSLEFRPKMLGIRLFQAIKIINHYDMTSKEIKEKLNLSNTLIYDNNSSR